MNELKRSLLFLVSSRVLLDPQAHLAPLVPVVLLYVWLERTHSHTHTHTRTRTLTHTTYTARFKKTVLFL